MSLNQKYFEIIKTVNIGNYDYQVVRPLGNPMVLFSNIDGTPLAAFQVRCQDGQTGNSLITRRLAGETNFQALIDRDHQEIEFAITNLTGEGMVKIDIMKNGDKIVDVDPRSEKGGVNQVNELHEYQSYAVKCDQKDNLSFILDAIKKNNGSHLTVGEAESEKKSQAAKYWISVVAEAGKPQLVKKFTETFWSCPDVFVIRERHMPRIAKGMARARSDDDSDDEYGDEGTLDLCSLSMPQFSMNMSRSNEGSRGIIQSATISPMSMSRSSGPMLQSAMSIPGNNMDSIVNQSSAATVRGGRLMEVNSRVTGKGYAYDNHSVKCNIGLSVAEGLVFRNPPTKEELLEVGNTIIKHYTEESLKTYLNLLSQVFISEECVICMDGSPSSVFYSCGHQCCHYGCAEKLIKCPLCRNHIMANIKL